MDQVIAHQRAQDVFAGVLANIKPDQFENATPCTEWDVKAVIDHVIGGNYRVAGGANSRGHRRSQEYRYHHKSDDRARREWRAFDRQLSVRMGKLFAQPALYRQQVSPGLL